MKILSSSPRSSKSKRFRCSDGVIVDIYGLPVSGGKVFFDGHWKRLVAKSKRGKGKNVVSFSQIKDRYESGERGYDTIGVLIGHDADGKGIFTTVALNSAFKPFSSPPNATVQALASREADRIGRSIFDRLDSHVDPDLASFEMDPNVAVMLAESGFVGKYGFLTELSSSEMSPSSLAAFAVYKNLSDETYSEILSRLPIQKLQELHATQFGASLATADTDVIGSVDWLASQRATMVARAQLVEERFPLTVADLNNFDNLFVNYKGVTAKALMRRFESSSSQVRKEVFDLCIQASFSKDQYVKAALATNSALVAAYDYDVSPELVAYKYSSHISKLPASAALTAFSEKVSPDDADAIFSMLESSSNNTGSVKQPPVAAFRRALSNGFKDPTKVKLLLDASLDAVNFKIARRLASRGVDVSPSSPVHFGFMKASLDVGLSSKKDLDMVAASFRSFRSPGDNTNTVDMVTAMPSRWRSADNVAFLVSSFDDSRMKDVETVLRFKDVKQVVRVKNVINSITLRADDDDLASSVIVSATNMVMLADADKLLSSHPAASSVDVVDFKKELSQVIAELDLDSVNVSALSNQLDRSRSRSRRLGHEMSLKDSVLCSRVNMDDFWLSSFVDAGYSVESAANLAAYSSNDAVIDSNAVGYFSMVKLRHDTVDLLQVDGVLPSDLEGWRVANAVTQAKTNMSLGR